MNQAKCTTCGAVLTIKQGDKTCVCAYCQSTNIVENALALGKVEVDVTEDIKKLRTNLTTFVQQNSIDEILRVSQKLLDWIPQDFVALYFFGYAKQQQNQPRFLYDFYKESPTHTADELKLVIDHLMRYSELRDKPRIVLFLETLSPKLIKQYEQIHEERETQEDNYSSIPRDVFVCFSSYNKDIAERVVEELEADGNTCWISTRNLRPEDTENYWRNIENAINNSSIFLIISSEDSMRSKDVHQELEFAKKYEKKMVEFKIDDSKHNTLFKHLFDGNKWVKGTKESNQSYNKLLQRIFEEKTLSIPKKISKNSVIVPKRKSYSKFIIGGITAVIAVSLFVVLMFSGREIEMTLNGSSSIVLSAGDSYQELGATAINGRNEVFAVEIIGSVNTSRPGNYTVIYRANDGSGQVSEVERLIQIIDTTSPEIIIDGASTINLFVGDEFVEPGVRAIDNVDGVISVTIDSTIDTSTEGVYTITYSAIDAAGNRAPSIARSVVVEAQVVPNESLSSEIDTSTLDVPYLDYLNDTNPRIAITFENYDPIILELFPDVAPLTVAQISRLVEINFYDGIIFHRIIEGFMIQGGDPTGTGGGGSGQQISGEFVANGVPNRLRHWRGVLSMARSGDPNSASSQFFIVHQDANFLDGEYAAFGGVIQGFDTLDALATVETNDQDRPLEDVVMLSVRLLER